jgi:hypothetical protein
MTENKDGDKFVEVSPPVIGQSYNNKGQYIPSQPEEHGASLFPDKPVNIISRIEQENKKDSALDIQIGGSHYKNFKIQPIEFIMKNDLNFCQGNAIKYICRYKEKNGIEDLKKAIHYINLLIQLEYGDDTNQGIRTK